MSDNHYPAARPGRDQRPGSRASAVANRVYRRGGLWGNPSFLRIWLANAIDDFGTQISGLAIPLTAAVTLGAGPFEMGMLAAAQRLPYFALGLFAGVLVDRRPRQPLMVTANWLRAIVLALVPMAALLGVLSINLLYSVAVLAGTFGLVFDVAYVAWLPSLVEPDELHDANGKLESTAAAAQAAGPGIAGVLVGIVSAPFTIAADALSFVVSAALIRSIRAWPRLDDDPDREIRGADGRPAKARAVFSDIGEGIQAVWRDDYLRAVVSCSAVVSFFGFVFLAVYLLFMTNVLGLSPAEIGLILAAGGIGAVIGAAAAVPLSRRLGFGPTIIWAQIVFAVTGITVPIAVYVPSLAVPMLALSEFAQYGAFAMYSVGALSLRQARTPADRQGRTSASVRAAVSGAALLGSIVGGLLGDWIGLGQTLVVGIVGMGLGCLLVIASPLRTLRDLAER